MTEASHGEPTVSRTHRSHASGQAPLTRRQIRIQRELEEAAKSRTSRRQILAREQLRVSEPSPTPTGEQTNADKRVRVDERARVNEAPRTQEPQQAAPAGNSFEKAPRGVSRRSILAGEQAESIRGAELASAGESTSIASVSTGGHSVATELSVDELEGFVHIDDESADLEDSTTILTLEEIGGAICEGVKHSRDVRVRRALTAAPAPSFGTRKWALQGVFAGAMTALIVGVPMLLAGGTSAKAAGDLSASLVGGTAIERIDTPSSLTGEKTAAVRSAVTDASAQGASFTCADQSAGGVRAAFAPVQTQNVVMPLQEGTYHLTSAYGYRVDPIYGGTSMHAGQDFAAPLNTQIHAVADGVVTHAGEGIEGRSNNLIIVKHEIHGKTFYTWYIHMYGNGVLVKEGDTVKAGQVIGLVGSNGNSTGPHLHLEVHDADNQLTDPVQWLKDHGAIDISQLCK